MEKLSRLPDRAADRNAESREPCRTAVVGACRGAGASFVSLRVLTKGLFGERTPSGLRTLCELGTPYFYLALGFDRRFAGREFYGFSSHGRQELNMELGYNWYVKGTEETEMSERDILRNLYGAAGDFIVFDCSGLNDMPVLADVLSEADRIYLVVDPMPTRLIASGDFIGKTLEMFPKTEIVVDRYAKGIHRGQLRAFRGTGNYHTVENVPIEKLYRAEYNCAIPEI